MNILRFGTICLTSLLVGCAIGNTYDYEHSNVDLAVQGQRDLGLAVIDQRPYVLSGDKKPDFVGLQRGGFYNPFNVSTENGRPLADNMADAIASELRDNGFKVVDLQISAPDMTIVAKAIRDAAVTRNVILTVLEWKTDAYTSFVLSYALNLKVTDNSAQTLAETEISGVKESLGGAGFESSNSISAANAFSSKISRLFNDPDVIRALNE